MTDLVGAVVSSAVAAFVAGFLVRPVADGVMRVGRKRRALDAGVTPLRPAPLSGRGRELVDLGRRNQGIRPEDEL